MPRALIIVVGIVGYMVLLIPFWLGFDLQKLAHSPLRVAVISTTYGRTVFAFMVSTVPLLIDTLLDFFQRFSSKITNHYVLGRFIYAIVTFISSVLLVLNTFFPELVIFTADPVLSYLLILYGLRIGTASALMYILASVSPNICGVVLPLLITLYVVATNITRFYYLAFFDRPFQFSVIMLLVLLILIICVYIYWSILLYRKRKTWTLQDYSTIMYMVIYLITYSGSFMTIGHRIQARNLYSDISTSTTIDISFTALSFVVSTVLMTIVPGRIARLEASNNLKTILDTKKSYVRYISHELRTPMNTVFMGINLCIDDSDTGSGRSIQTNNQSELLPRDSVDFNRDTNMSQKEDILKDTSVACNAAIDILNDLLLYDKVENDMMVLSKTMVPIVELVHDSLKMFNIQYRHKKIELVIDNGGNLNKDTSTIKLYSNRESNNLSDLNNSSWKIVNTTIDIGASTDLEVHDNSVINDEDILELDKAKMIQVIRNVMSNALKFTPEGGQIYVNIRYEEGDTAALCTSETNTNMIGYKRGISLFPNFKVYNFAIWVFRYLCTFIRTMSCGLIAWSFQDPTNHDHCAINTPGYSGQFVMTVRDTGAGISTENQGQLFHNIIQFKPEILQQGGGSGLGLYISKSIVDKHHGTIDVYSAGEGQGTTFTIKLPMTRAQSIKKNLSIYNKPSAELTRNITIVPSVNIDVGTPSVSMEPSPEHHDSTCTCTYNDYNEPFSTLTLADETPHDMHTTVMKTISSLRASRDLATAISAHDIHVQVGVYQQPENDSNIKEQVSSHSLVEIHDIINTDKSDIHTVIISKNMETTDHGIKPYREKHIVNSMICDDYEVGDIDSDTDKDSILVHDGSNTAYSRSVINTMDSNTNIDSYQNLQTDGLSLRMNALNMSTTAAATSPFLLSNLHIMQSSPQLAVSSQNTSNTSTNRSSATSSRATSFSESTMQSGRMIKSKQPSLRLLHVLIVDDSSMNRKMMARLLSSVHYTYNEAGDGVEAVQIMTQSMKRHPYNRQTSDQVSDVVSGPEPVDQAYEKFLVKPFDVILMDFMMPNMDGPTATAEIRKLGYTGLIYGVTGNAQQFDIDHFIEKGANKVFVKPLILSDLTKELKSQFPI